MGVFISLTQILLRKMLRGGGAIVRRASVGQSAAVPPPLQFYN